MTYFLKVLAPVDRAHTFLENTLTWRDCLPLNIEFRLMFTLICGMAVQPESRQLSVERENKLDRKLANQN